VTNRITQNTDAISDNIRTLREQATQQAKMAYYKKIVDSFAAAYEAQYAAEQELFALQQQELQLKEELAMAEAILQAANIRGDANLAAKTERVNELNAALLDNRKNQTSLSEEVERASAVLAEEEARLDAATKGLESYGEAGGEAVESVLSLTEAQAALSEAYATAKDAARKSIDSQIGLFDELVGKSDWSAEKIIENWANQERAFTNYEDNLKKAVELGLDEALIEQLSDGSQQSMQILDAMVNDVDISVDEINAAFRDRMTAKESLVSTMGEIRGIVEGTFDDLAEAAAASGRDIIDGAILGINSNKKRFTAALAGMAKEAQNDGWNQAWMRHSPSRWMMAASDDIVDGGVLQIQRRAPDMAKAMADLAGAGQAAYQDQLDTVAEYPSLMGGVPG
jgi:hypothetical protein